MNPERWSRIRAVLEPALDLPAPERSQWLDDHCDPGLRAEVDDLIRASETVDLLADRPTLRADRPLPVGTVLGPYIVESDLGAGGMGTVYRVFDPRLRRVVAAKVLGLGSGVEDLVREARALAALSHPNIVAVHDIFEYRDTPVIVMELVDGRPLDEVLAEGRLDLHAAARIAREVASALVAAHRAGVLHRDLKPANVVMGPQGEVKVLDFGIARPVDGAARPARPAGTVGHAAPEQLRGAGSSVRSDVYSFGVLLRHLVAGAATGGVVVPRAWARCIERCTAKDPGARYPDMDQVERAVARLARPRRFMLGVAAAVLIAVAAGAAAFLATERGDGADAPLYRAVQLPGSDPSRIDPAISPDGRTIAFAVHGVEGPSLFLQGVDAVASHPLGVRGRQPAWHPSGLRLAFRSDDGPGGLFEYDLETREVRRVADSGYFPDWSPDGRWLAYSSEDFERVEERPTSTSSITILDLETGETRRLTDPDADGDAIQPDWSADGRRIAYWSIGADARRSVWTVAANGGAPVQVTDGTAQAWTPEWAPDGRLYWSSDRAGTMAMWRVRVGTSTGAVQGVPQMVTLPARYVGSIGAGGSGELVFASHERSTSIHKVSLDAPDTPPQLITPRGLGIAYPSVSPDGQWLVAFEEAPSNRLVLIRTDGGEFRYLTGGSFRDRDPHWSPDGSRIAFLSNRSGDYQIWAIRPDGSGLEQLFRLETGAFSPYWAPDSTHLVFFTRLFRPMVFDVATRSTVALPAAPAPGFRPTDWSLDGDRIVGVLRSESGANLGVAILELAAGDYVVLSGRCDGVRWLPDGETLLCARGRTLLLIDATTETERLVRELREPMDGGLTVSRDGRYAYVVTRTDESQIWLALPYE